jgi:hypothetical protein
MMTAQDLVERLIDFAGADTGDKILRQARRAMQDALREFPGLHRWTYHYGQLRLQLVAAYSDGTVEYDATTRELTLADGTWPSWAASGSVRINDVVAQVASRDSGTVLTMASAYTFSDDIDSGTAYTLYQDQYDLPADFLASDSAIAEQRFGTLRYVVPGSAMWAERTALRLGTPTHYTFLPSRTTAGRLAMRVTPIPDAAQTLDAVYQRRMRGIVHDGNGPYATGGSVSVTEGLKAVTGVNTHFRSDMVGSVLRCGADSATPSGPDGLTPALFSSVIAAVTDATTLTVTDAAPQDFAGVAYTISDPLDLEEGTMLTSFMWQAIKHLANELRMKDLANIQAGAAERLREAREADSRDFGRRVAGPGGIRRQSLRDMPSGPDDV